MGYSVRRLVFVGENKWIKCDTVKHAFFSPASDGIKSRTVHGFDRNRIPIRILTKLFYFTPNDN